MALTERICAFCNKEISGTPVVCVRCHALYHQECWNELERCIVYGCNEPKESYGIVDTKTTEMTCSACNKKNPRAVQNCLHCGQAVGKEVKRSVFVSFGGWRGTTDEEVINGLSQHWDSAIRHLYGGDVEHWFKSHGHSDWAQKAEEIRKNEKQRSIGLEKFLQYTKLAPAPTIKINPPRLILESSASNIDTVLDISNTGRGYLFGSISANVDWISFKESEFIGNYNRLELSIAMDKLPSDTASGLITIKSLNQENTVEVKATRIGVENAIKAYEAGELAKAKALCRRLADNQSIPADVALVLAACYLAEENSGGASSVLSKLTGSCIRVQNNILDIIYTWIKSENFLGGLDQFNILEAMMATAQGELKEKIKSDLAKLALEKAIDFGASVGAGSNLWQDRSEVSESVNELLQMAVELDPNVAEDANSIRKQYKGHHRKRGLNKIAMYTAIALILGGFIGGSWWMSSNQEEREYIPISRAIEAKKYDEAIKEARILCDNSPENTRYFKYYIMALAAQAKDDIAENRWEKVQSRIHSISGLVSDHFALATMASEKLCDLASDLEGKGLLGEARILYENAASLNSQNNTATMKLVSLSSSTETFWKIYKVATGDLGRHVCNDCANKPSLKEPIASLESMGVKCYPNQMQVTFRDIDGDAQRELVVCGTNGNKAKNPQGAYDVYRLSGNKLEKVHSDTVNCGNLLYMSSYDFSGEQRYDIVMAWSKTATDSERTIMLLADKSGKFISEKAPGTGYVEFADHDNAGGVEIWIAKGVDGGDYEKGIKIYEPFIWSEPGFVEASGNFDKYYNSRIADLTRELEDNPHKKGSPAFISYESEHQKAIEILKSRLQGEK